MRGIVVSARAVAHSFLPFGWEVGKESAPVGHRRPTGARALDEELCGLLLADEDVDRCTREVPVRTDLILEEAAIGLLDPLREVRKEGEAGHRRGELHDVLNLDVLTLRGRGRCCLDDG